MRGELPTASLTRLCGIGRDHTLVHMLSSVHTRLCVHNHMPFLWTHRRTWSQTMLLQGSCAQPLPCGLHSTLNLPGALSPPHTLLSLFVDLIKNHWSTLWYRAVEAAKTRNNQFQLQADTGPGGMEEAKVPAKPSWVPFRVHSETLPNLLTRNLAARSQFRTQLPCASCKPGVLCAGHSQMPQTCHQRYL